jgi:hypothetical protein
MYREENTENPENDPFGVDQTQSIGMEFDLTIR